MIHCIRNPAFFLLSTETTSPDMMSQVYIRADGGQMICVHLERHLENSREAYAVINILDQETISSNTLGVITFQEGLDKFFKNPESHSHPIEVITGPVNHDWSNREHNLELILSHAVAMTRR